MIDQEQKRKRTETIVKAIGLGVVGLLVAPVIFVAIKGLIGVVVAATISFAVINFIPWFAAKMGNWRLKALKHEAAQNPIETLQTDFQNRMTALQSFRNSIQDFSGEVATFKDKLVGFKKTYPNDSLKFDEQFAQMKALLELRKNKYQEAKGNLALYESEINKAKAIWEMAQAAAAMNKAAGVDADEFLAKIQVETALDSVQKSLNNAFADLEISLLDEDGKKKVAPTPETSGAKPHNVLDLSLDATSTKSPRQKISTQ
jgi:hypothetical protein